MTMNNSGYFKGDVDIEGTLTVGGGTVTGGGGGGGATVPTAVALGDLIYASAASTWARLAGQITAARQFLAQTGTGSVSAAPVWAALVAADIPSLDAAKIATGVIDQARLGSGSDGSGTHYLADDQTYKSVTAVPIGYNYREEWLNKNQGGTAATAVGMAAPGTSTLVNADDADGAFGTMTTGTTGGAATGFASANTNYTRRDWSPEMVASIKTPSTITTIGIWVCLSSVQPLNTYDPSGAHLAGFRYYTQRSSADATAVDNTAFWRTVTKDGTTENVTTTAQSLAVDTAYTLRMICGASSVLFYINDALVATHTTNLPTTSQGMGWFLQVTALAGSAARSLKFSRIWFRMK